MSLRRRFALLGASLVLIAGSSLPARAGDAPPAPAAQPAVRKIENAVLDGLVGSWDVALKGSNMEGTGRSIARKIAGGTALLQETEVVVAGRTWYALNVVRLADATTVKVWRFDTLSGVDVTALRGTLAADGFDASSETGRSFKMRKVGAGYEATLSSGGQTFAVSTYTKAAKDVVLESPNAPTVGLLPAMIGAWDVAGEWKLPEKDGTSSTTKISGTSTYRWALGGSIVVHDFDRTTPMGPTGAFGVYRWPVGGASVKVWWFEGMQVDPMLADGPLTETGWHGKGTFPDGITMGLEWSRKGDGLEMRYDIDGKPAGSEIFTKKK